MMTNAYDWDTVMLSLISLTENYTKTILVVDAYSLLLRRGVHLVYLLVARQSTDWIQGEELI